MNLKNIFYLSILLVSSFLQSATIKIINNTSDMLYIEFATNSKLVTNPQAIQPGSAQLFNTNADTMHFGNYSYITYPNDQSEQERVYREAANPSLWDVRPVHGSGTVYTVKDKTPQQAASE